MNPILDKEILDQLVYQMKSTLDTIYKLKKLKASKQPKLEWEIVAYRFKCHNSNNNIITESQPYHWSFAISGSIDYEIYSVKRVSDNEVFSLGDKVTYLPVNQIHWVIDNFHVTAEGKMLARSEYNMNVEEVNQYLGKVKQVLFTTEDGVKMHDGDTYCLLTDNFNQIFEHLQAKDFIGKNNKGTFSTKEKAEAYRLHNAPVLSLKEISDNGMDEGSQFFLRLIQKAKDKLNLK